MMSKTLIIQQPFGLGDCIWAQTIANDYINDGYKVLWPVKQQWVEGLQRAYPKINWIDQELIPINYENKKLYEENGFTYLPMRFSEYLMGKPYKFHMESKYSFLGKDWKRWRECAMPKRYKSKEMELYELIKQKYRMQPVHHWNLICENFGSSGNHKIKVVSPNEYTTNVYLEEIEGYSLFDWMFMMEGADEIHAVSSSSLYLFELLSGTVSGWDYEQKIHLYPRKPIENDFEYVKFLFTKPYILHD